jgi:DNA-binding NarL/FixJ family response regulator
MMTPAELAEFNEISYALEIVKASKYSEAQINGMEKYLDEVRTYHSGMAYAEEQGIHKALQILHDLKSGLPVSEIAEKYDIDEATVLSFKTV